MKSPRLLLATACIATLGTVPAARASTTITPWGDGTINANHSGLAGVANLNAGNAGAVGGNTNATVGNRRTFFQVTSYNVATLLTDLGGITLAQLSNYTFNYSGTTVAGTTGAGADIADTFEYHAAYIGQWQDTGTAGASAGDVPQTGVYSVATLGQTTNVNWTRYHDAATTLAAGTSAQTVDLNLIDDATAQSLSATGFDLSGLAAALAGDSDLTNNFVFFGFRLSPDYENNIAANQEISGVSLVAVPESGIAVLGSFGLLGLLRRRRRGHCR